MNQDQNNYNFQSNNDVPNNQPLSNNQNLSNTFNQSTQQAINNNQSQYTQNTNFNEQNNLNNQYQNQNTNNQQVNYSNIQYSQNQNSRNNLDNEKNGNLTVSIVLGILSLVLSFAINILTLPISITGLVLGLTSKTKSNKKIAGIVLNTISIVIALGFIILSIGKVVDELGNFFGSGGVYTGDGFNLKYDSPWSVTTLSGGQESLVYEYEKGYFVAIGKSDLNSTTKLLNCSFETSSCQKQIYDSFYDYWSSNPPAASMALYDGSNGFSILKDDIYYATMDYGISSDNINGKLYLLISNDKNVILSFLSNSTESSEHDKRVLSLLQNIEIYDNSGSSSSDDNVVYDDTLYNSLNSLSNWNRYSELRNGSLGKVKNMTGGWRILNDSESYWEFKNDEFWWYKSVNDLSDNYWYGNTQIVTGKEGLKLVGLDENKVDSIVSQSSGNVTANDIYAIVMTPTKIISGGVDKSDTNIPENSKWNYVWIVYDHGSEGIEGQVLDLSSYDTSYYVKIED